jgi:hypothetical protein
MLGNGVRLSSRGSPSLRLGSLPPVLTNCSLCVLWGARGATCHPPAVAASAVQRQRCLLASSRGIHRSVPGVCCMSSFVATAASSAGAAMCGLLCRCGLTKVCFERCERVCLVASGQGSFWRAASGVLALLACVSAPCVQEESALHRYSGFTDARGVPACLECHLCGPPAAGV